MGQLNLFGFRPETVYPRPYRPFLTISQNGKGVVDCDTVKGCTVGMAKYPAGGCYGECYAYKTAHRYGLNFRTSITRRITPQLFGGCFSFIARHPASWYRIGTAGDPSHDWENTITVCEALRSTRKVPVIITKHWVALTEDQLLRLKSLSAVVNTSTSGMDTDQEIKHRVRQIIRIKHAGLTSVCRVVTCEFGKSEWAKDCQAKQNFLLSFDDVIDNPFRASKNNVRVLAGEIVLTHKPASRGGGGKYISLHDESVYLGTCTGCPDQCGVKTKQGGVTCRKSNYSRKQLSLYT